MIRFTQGNLLEARTEALVNTVNTVGVMGKGIALMFKKRFAENYRLYSAACKAGDVETGKVHVTAVDELGGPRWIVRGVARSASFPAGTPSQVRGRAAAGRG
jgi:O-acetyl-ADP-ribose deacetylase (regulator of RNase III)